MDDERLDDLNKKYYKPENYLNFVAPKAISEVNSENSNCIKLKIKNSLTTPTPNIRNLFRFDIRLVISNFFRSTNGRTTLNNYRKRGTFVIKRECWEF